MYMSMGCDFGFVMLRPLAFIRCVKQGHEARTSASIWWGRHVESVT